MDNRMLCDSGKVYIGYARSKDLVQVVIGTEASGVDGKEEWAMCVSKTRYDRDVLSGRHTHREFRGEKNEALAKEVCGTLKSKDIRPPSYFLGIDFIWNGDNGLLLRQTELVKAFLENIVIP